MDVRTALLVAVAGVGLSGCMSDSGYRSNSSYQQPAPYGGRVANCYDCGVVQSISSYNGERRASGAGAVIGAVVGGALGNQVGGGDGKTAATVAGAVVGGLVGNNIEKNRNNTWYELRVRMDDGRAVVVTQNDLNGVNQGSRVILRDGKAYLN